MTINVGDIVKYKSSFLQSIGCYAGDMAHGEGKIIAIEPMGSKKLAVIDWNADLPKRVLMDNLVLKSRLHLEPR